MVGPSKRHILGTLVPIAYDMGSFLLVFLAFFLRDWRWLQLALTSPMVISVFYWWRAILPESPRWLLSLGRTNSAIKIIKKIARINRSETCHIGFINVEDRSGEIIKVILKKLFTSKALMTRLVVILIDLFVLAFIYFGVTLNLGFLGENLYITFFINAIVETMGNCLQFFVNKTGRRRMFLSCLFSMALFFIASVCTDMLIQHNTDLNWITVALTMIGKLMISLGYGLIYVYTGELFPTVVRGGVMGLCTLSASAGSLITPYLYTLFRRYNAGKSYCRSERRKTNRR